MRATQKPDRRFRSLCFQPLENRSLMAGDVTVAVNNGVLQITGDSTENSVQISQAGKIWKVRGVGTTINGNADVQSFSGVANISINLGHGNDTLVATKGKLRAGANDGLFEIRDDGGMSTITLTNVNVKEFDVQTHNEADQLFLTKCSAAEIVVETFSVRDEAGDHILFANCKLGNVSVSTSGGNDSITVANTAVSAECLLRTNSELSSTDPASFSANDADSVMIYGSRIKQDFALLAGEGSDIFVLSRVQFKADVLIVTAHAENDSIQDTVEATGLAVGGKLTIFTGGGSDEIEIIKSSAKDRIDIIATTEEDTGSDTVTLNQVKSGENIVIETGGGTDEVNLTKLTVAEVIGVHLGDGNTDRLSLTHSRAFGILLIGGDGSGDEVTLAKNKWRSEFVDVVGFELELS